ncbi:DUF6891 domain-containing protein [Nocardiopsis ganjiahuensis]|uniref:DUF6891 domain-containing protein n=1 Tax=Nocardiopsis ganjiahuensis TaxID=239984 RepID=UPI0003486BF0|nr:hypothetical protein [Nocardiopsis ganjiahuensis]
MDDKWDPRNLPDGSMSGNGHQSIRARVLIGEDYDGIMRHTVTENLEYLDDLVNSGETRGLPTDDPDELRTWVIGILDAEYTAHRQWCPAPDGSTDSDRLTRAFRSLDTSGIIAREFFDRNPREANGRLASQVAQGPGARGYACYTAEDGEYAAEGGRLLVGYGSREGTPEADAAVGAEVTAVLREYGLDVEWDGDPGRRLDVRAATMRRAGRPARGTAEGDRSQERTIEVSYQDTVGEGGIGQSGPRFVDLQEYRELLYRLTPEPRSFLVASAPSGDTVQVMWEPGPKLWVESPKPAEGRSIGRHATLAEAAELVGVLATEDRADLSLLGDLETRVW